jgi:hypothetical protein
VLCVQGLKVGMGSAKGRQPKLQLASWEDLHDVGKHSTEVVDRKAFEVLQHRCLRELEASFLVGEGSS